MEHFWVSLERQKEAEPHWQVRQINGVEQQEWWKGRSYSSWEAYADEMRLDGWELPVVDFLRLMELLSITEIIHRPL